MDWLFFRQSIWYCIYFRQIWLVKGICISFPHLNLHPTFHPPGGAPCTSYLSSIRFERAREDPSNLSSITETALHRLFITQHHLTASATWCSDRKNKRLTKKGEIIKRYIQKSEDHNEVQEYHCKCALDAFKICWNTCTTACNHDRVSSIWQILSYFFTMFSKNTEKGFKRGQYLSARKWVLTENLYYAIRLVKNLENTSIFRRTGPLNHNAQFWNP